MFSVIRNARDAPANVVTVHKPLKWNDLCAERSTGKSVANYKVDQSFIIYDSK